jgi:FAD/FMN-containing dehydrogenase
MSHASDRTEPPGANAATLRQEVRACFSGRLLTAPADMEPFLIDWRRRWQGAALAVAQPDRTQDVAALVAWCARRHVPVVPQGGNTGLSGGSVPDASGTALVLSLARLNRVRAVDAANLTITVEAGCTLRQVQAEAAAVGLLFPLSLAAEGSCTIGGNLATNAGGVRALRYGVARDLCIGLEVVTASGETWDGLRRLRKDNTGYDLRDLFIGSEGTLGVITAAVLKLFPRPVSTVTAFAAVASPAAALSLLHLAQARLGPDLAAFELVSDICLGLVVRHFPDHRLPLADRSDFYVLIETFSSLPAEASRAAMIGVLETALLRGWTGDAVIAESSSQAASIWRLREAISDAQGMEGPNIKHDVSLPVSAIPACLAQIGEALAGKFPDLRLVVFGHLGDGNLHANVSPPAGCLTPRDKERFLSLEIPVNQLIHGIVVAHGGSISAEHGLGVLRRDEAARLRPAHETELMRRIKCALDPDGLMNPDKVLPTRIFNA